MEKLEDVRLAVNQLEEQEKLTLENVFKFLDSITYEEQFGEDGLSSLPIENVDEAATFIERWARNLKYLLDDRKEVLEGAGKLDKLEKFVKILNGWADEYESAAGNLEKGPLEVGTFMDSRQSAIDKLNAAGKLSDLFAEHKKLVNQRQSELDQRMKAIVIDMLMEE